MSQRHIPRNGTPGDPNCYCACHFSKNVSHVMACCRVPDEAEEFQRISDELLAHMKRLNAVLGKPTVPQGGSA